MAAIRVQCTLVAPLWHLNYLWISCMTTSGEREKKILIPDRVNKAKGRKGIQMH